MKDELSHEILKARILSKQARVAIIGLGYVGLPLAKAFNAKGFPVIGFDIDRDKIAQLKNGRSYIKTFTHDAIKKMLESQRLELTFDPHDLKSADILIICVPTPLTKNREPDMFYVNTTVEMIQQNLVKGQLIVFESTTYPGTTKELIADKLTEKKIEYFLAYSPEREDPGNPNYETSTIPKVVGADDPHSLELTQLLYQQIVPVVTVSSSATAEAVKLTENIFRSVNIALVNELKMVYAKMGIDIWEVIDAAATKPFGYMPFYPGPGLGGHCIPIDPFYLTWKAREYGVTTRFVELAGEINTLMPHYVIEQLRNALDERFAKSLNGARILLVGLAYKKNVDDIRESPSLVIYELLQQKKAIIDYYDPYVLEIPPTREHSLLKGIKSISWTAENLAQYDAVIICTNHDEIDYAFLVRHAKLIIDTRHATEKVEEKNNVIPA